MKVMGSCRVESEFGLVVTGQRCYTLLSSLTDNPLIIHPCSKHLSLPTGLVAPPDAVMATTDEPQSSSDTTTDKDDPRTKPPPPPPPSHPPTPISTLKRTPSSPLYLPLPTPASSSATQGDATTAHPSTCRLSLRLTCPLVEDKLHLTLSLMLHGSREQWRVHLGFILRASNHGADVELPYSARVHATVWRVVGGDQSASDAPRWRRWAKVDIETRPRPP